MKAYQIELAKKVIAEFTMNYEEFKIKFECNTYMRTWIVSQHPELADCPSHYRFTDDEIVLEFYSIGDPVIVEK